MSYHDYHIRCQLLVVATIKVVLSQYQSTSLMPSPFQVSIIKKNVMSLTSVVNISHFCRHITIYVHHEVSFEVSDL